ncbi:MAG TPA: winged helix-turn-helix domain-containing protein [Kofleriaceae bacterium]
MKTVLRRAEPAAQRFGDLEVDPVKHQVRLRGEVVALTAAELRIVETLARAPGRVFSRDELVRRALAGEANDRTVDAHVKNLRKKLDAQRIVTVIGLGYKLG